MGMMGWIVFVVLFVLCAGVILVLWKDEEGWKVDFDEDWEPDWLEDDWELAQDEFGFWELQMKKGEER